MDTTEADDNNILSPDRQAAPQRPRRRNFSSPANNQQSQQQQQEQYGHSVAQQQQRRASCTNTTSSGGPMSVSEQDERRRRIKAIMQDGAFTQAEKSKIIQGLMDGRTCRRNSETAASHCSAASGGGGAAHSYVNNMGRAAAAKFTTSGNTSSSGGGYSGDNNNDSVTAEADVDHRSAASSVTTRTDYSTTHHQAGGDFRGRPASGMSYRQFHGRSFSLQDWNDTDRVTAAANTTIHFSSAAGLSRLMEQSRPACDHYERNCTLISPCCGLAFGCRICHDECPVLPPPVTSNADSTSGGATKKTPTFQSKLERRRSMPVDLDDDDDEAHHLIDRFAVKEVVCRSCYSRQSSKTNKCISCGVQFGAYHCDVCNLWMSEKEAPYHCDECGFCRVGGRENFRHCDACGMCIDAMLFDDHNCKSGKYMSNCPICQEDLFSSRFASHEMPCGHAIHWHCFKELTSYDTRCPVCKKTAESPEQMAATWSAIAMGIALQPVPADMARVVNIVCNDCENPDSNRRWHFLGVRCMHCPSFNTSVEQIVMQGRDASDFLEALEQRNGNQDGIPSNISMPSVRRSLSEAARPDNSDRMEEEEGAAVPQEVPAESPDHVMEETDGEPR